MLTPIQNDQPAATADQARPTEAHAGAHTDGSSSLLLTIGAVFVALLLGFMLLLPTLLTAPEPAEASTPRPNVARANVAQPPAAEPPALAHPAGAPLGSVRTVAPAPAQPVATPATQPETAPASAPATTPTPAPRSELAEADLAKLAAEIITTTLRPVHDAGRALTDAGGAEPATLSNPGALSQRERLVNAYVQALERATAELEQLRERCARAAIQQGAPDAQADAWAQRVHAQAQRSALPARLATDSGYARNLLASVRLLQAHQGRWSADDQGQAQFADSQVGRQYERLLAERAGLLRGPPPVTAAR
jgi:hypothetical protein